MVKSLCHPLFFLRLPSNALPDIVSVGEPGGTVPNKISQEYPPGDRIPFSRHLSHTGKTGIKHWAFRLREDSYFSFRSQKVESTRERRA